MNAVAPFIKLLVALLEQKLADYWLQNQFPKFLWRCQKKHGTAKLIKSLHQNEFFVRNCESFEISLLQCYVLLWIHNIDMICRNTTKYFCEVCRLIKSSSKLEVGNAREKMILEQLRSAWSLPEFEIPALLSVGKRVCFGKINFVIFAYFNK